MNLPGSKIPRTALVCAVVILALGTVAMLRSHTIDPHVTAEQGRTRVAEARVPLNRRLIATTMEGEVAHTAERLTEASALAVAASLYAANEVIKGHTPRTAQNVLAGIEKNKLLPPGVSLTTANSELSSSHGRLTLRYRPSPLGIEVVALGRDRSEGPAILVRVPDESSSAGAVVFTSTRLNEVKLPSPFIPAAEVIALGWSPETLRSFK
jgi:hypothetical protein